MHSYATEVQNGLNTHWWSYLKAEARPPDSQVASPYLTWMPTQVVLKQLVQERM